MNSIFKLFNVLIFIILGLFAQASDYYWVGGNGTWSDINHWATASGSLVKHLVVPSPTDNVFFDQNSATGSSLEVQLNNMIITCNNFNCSNINKSLTFSDNGVQKFEIYGSFYLNQLVVWNSNVNIFFKSTQTGKQINSAGKNFGGNISFDGSNGSWELLDILSCTGDTVFLNKGQLTSNGFKISCWCFISVANYARSLNISNSVVNIGSLWNIENSNFSISAINSTIIFPGNGRFIHDNTGTLGYHDVFMRSKNSSHSFVTQNATFNRVEIFGDAGIQGNNTYNDLVFYKGKTYTFEQSQTHTFIDSLIAVGNCMDFITIKTNGAYTDFKKTSGNIKINYIQLQSIHASGGATFTATNSSDWGGNSGWTISPISNQTLYWVNGTGEWHDTTHWSYSSGGPPGACPPTFKDDVFFDNNSFSSLFDKVEISSTDAYCRNMTWIAGNYKPIFANTSSPVLHIHGSLAFQSSMTNQFKSIVHFAADTLAKTILMAGQHMKGLVKFEGNYGGWTLLDSFIVDDQNIELNKGHLNTNSKYVSCFRFDSYQVFKRALTLGNSTVVGTSDVIAFNFVGDSLLLNSGTSHLKCIKSSTKFKVVIGSNLTFYDLSFTAGYGCAQLLNSGSTYHDVKFESHGYLQGTATYNKLIFTKNKVYEITQGAKQTIITDLVALGTCSKQIVIRSDTNGFPTYIEKFGGTININRCILRDLKTLGTATFNAQNSTDMGNNNNWNFAGSTANDLYWVGGTGNWSDSIHWSYSSGGSGGACIPTFRDNVFFDNNSFSGSDLVTVDIPEAFCRNMTWLNSNKSAVFESGDSINLRIYGSLAFHKKMVNSFKGKVWFSSTSLGNTIKSAGNKFNNRISFIGRNGGWTLVDSLQMANQANGEIHFVFGNLYTDTNYVFANYFYSPINSKRTLNIFKSKIELNGGYPKGLYVIGDSLTLIADSSHIKLLSAGNFKNINGDTLKYFDVSFTQKSTYGWLYSQNVYCCFHRVYFAGHGNIRGNNSYDSIIFSKGHEYIIEENKTQKFNGLDAKGNCVDPITIRSTTSGVQTTLNKNADTVLVTFANLTALKATGTGKFIAENSNDLGNNTNWIITSTNSIDHFWVGGTGNWADTSHWSYSSGGPGGACIPTYKDDVYFDVNSFSTPGNNVILNINGECRSMSWTGALFTPVFTSNSSGFTLQIFGSLTFIHDMNTNMIFHVQFKTPVAGRTIKTAGKVFLNDITFSGDGSWYLSDSLLSDSIIVFEKGSLNFGNALVTATNFNSEFTTTRLLNFNNSKIYINSGQSTAWSLIGIGLNVIPGTSYIEFTNGGGLLHKYGTGISLYDVSFTKLSGVSYIKSDNTESKFNHVKIYNDGVLLGVNFYDSLSFYPNNIYKLDIDHDQTIGKYWWIRGNNCFPIRLESTKDGTQANVFKSTGSVSGDFIHMSDINAFGGAVFYAGNFSSNVSNNTGWNWNNAPNYIYGLGPDTFFTIGQSYTISTINFNGGPNTTYQWSNGSTAQNLVITTPGLYIVTVTYASNCKVIDSINIGCKLELLFTITDASCPGYSDGSAFVNVAGPVKPYFYYWMNGSTTQLIQNLTAGWYPIMVTDSTCIGFDSAKVGEPDWPNVTVHDTAFCIGGSITLDAGSGFLSYLWSDSSSGQTLFVNQPDSFWIIIMDTNGCVTPPKHFYVGEDTIPPLNLGTDTCISYQSVINLIPGDMDEYLWQNGSGASVFSVDYPGLYWVEVRKGTCYNHDTINIESCPPLLIVPNVFTPNGDGYNDVFKPVYQNITEYKLMILNRWGTVIFTSDAPDIGWDGSINGNECADGTYFFIIDYKNWGDIRNYYTKGSVTLFRN